MIKKAKPFDTEMWFFEYDDIIAERNSIADELDKMAGICWTLSSDAAEKRLCRLAKELREKESEGE